MSILSNLVNDLKKKQEKDMAEKSAEAAQIELCRQMIHDIRYNGVTPTPMQLDGKITIEIILEKDEKIYFILPGLLYLEACTSSANFNGSVRFNVAGSVTIGAGGTPKQTNKLEIVDTGSLYITNKKVVFLGSKKNVVIPIKRIVACNYSSNGLYIASSIKDTPLIVRESKPHPFVWDGVDAVLKVLITHAE